MAVGAELELEGREHGHQTGRGPFPLGSHVVRDRALRRCSSSKTSKSTFIDAVGNKHKLKVMWEGWHRSARSLQRSLASTEEIGGTDRCRGFGSSVIAP